MSVEYSIRLLSAASRTEEIEGKNRNLVYLFGTTREGEAIAVRTPLLMPYFQVVEPTKDILLNLGTLVSFDLGILIFIRLIKHQDNFFIFFFNFNN